ncbi:MAG TPA: PKD domain-containing protein [Thermoanaerobaculia bacterium]|nr:PKD domain-containing protein [Thermoanaerobaculia bacterium]
MNYRFLASLLLLTSLLPSVGCDKASPVAPSGTILSVSASPARIGLTGQSTITVIGRKPDGNPLNDGTEIRLTASLGSIEPFVTVDRNGTATATFRADGRLGTARITAATGGSTGSGGTGTGGTGTGGSSSGTLTASIDIQVGEVAGSILLQPTPTTLTSEGGPVSLLAIVLDASGQPLQNQGVNFSTELGTLRSRGATVTTNRRGEAVDTLTLSAADLANNTASVVVSARTIGGGAMGATAPLTASSTIRIQGDRPVASFSFTQGSTELSVQFIDTSSSQGAVTYSWNFGDGSSSNQANPVHQYAAAGSYNVVLTVTDASGLTDTATARITVPVTTGGSGS